MTEAEFTEIYRANADKVLSGITRIIHNEAVAQELTQEAFLKLLNAAAKSAVASPLGFLFQVSHNLAVDFVRKDKRMVSGIDDVRQESKMFGEAAMAERVLHREISARLKREGDEYLKFFILRADYAMSTDEIAEIMGMSRRSVFRLRDDVKKLLADFVGTD